MIEIEFLGPINHANMNVDISHLRELSSLLKNNTELSSWLEHCAVAVNDTLISTNDISLKNGDKVSLLPPVCGG